MNEKCQHPQRITAALNRVIKVAQSARGMNYEEFEAFQQELGALVAYWNTGQLPVAETVRPGDNGQQPTDSPPARGPRGARQKGRLADKPAASSPEADIPPTP